MKKQLFIFISLTVLLFACHRKSVPSSLPGDGKVVTEIGEASYYSDKYDGRKTSSGEIFKQKNFTAAHKELTFGTWVKVTNLSNNKSVMVRVNDRGPFVKGRIIDLSKAAAEKIDMVNAGVIKVKIEYRKK